jgi:hypothetical protein
VPQGLRHGVQGAGSSEGDLTGRNQLDVWTNSGTQAWQVARARHGTPSLHAFAGLCSSGALSESWARILLVAETPPLRRLVAVARRAELSRLGDPDGPRLPAD